MKKRILFVDDEAYILSAFKRMFRNMRIEWEMFFANGGTEALKIMSHHKIDIIVTDMLMPGMNGVELLQQVVELYPYTVRIILSGNIDKDMTFSSVNLAHQFINKPVDIENLKSKIELICQLRNLLGNKSMIKVATTIKKLPSLPSIYTMLVNEINSSEPSIKKIASIMSQDLVMTARVLQLVNSAFFGLTHKINNVQQAATLLGLDVLKTLIIYVNIFSSFNTSNCPFFPTEVLWEHSFMVGKMAWGITSKESQDKKQAEEAMIAGILHNIGYLCYLELPETCVELINLIKEKDYTLLEAEYQLMDISHAEIGAYLLGMWGFSDNIIKAVAYHHFPFKSSNNCFEVLTAVHVANALLSTQVSSEPALYPLLDLQYLTNLELLENMDKWKKYANELIKGENSNE